MCHISIQRRVKLRVGFWFKIDIEFMQRYSISGIPADVFDFR